jgi:hypothetical protein
MPDADFWHPAASRSVCAWRTWPQITHQAATTNCKTLGRDISRRRARRFRKGTKSRWSDIACSGGLSKQRRRGARSAPKSTRCKRHVTELGKRRSTTQPILAQPCFIETAARSALEALTTVASLGPRSNQSEPMKLQKTSPPSSVERPIATDWKPQLRLRSGR